jgi:hypothetical protein
MFMRERMKFRRVLSKFIEQKVGKCQTLVVLIAYSERGGYGPLLPLERS